MKKRLKDQLIVFIIFIVSFVFGFLLRDYFINNNPVVNKPPPPTTTRPTVMSYLKKKNILLPEAKEGKYKVIEVLDGDTIIIETGEKIRYLGIDAPELNDRWGPEAKQLNQDLVENKQARLEFDRTKIDKYGRLLAYVWVGDVLVNEKLIEEGYAKVNLMEGDPKLKYIEKLTKAEDWARNHHNGIWLDEWIK